MKDGGLGYSRLKSPYFPFDLDGGDSMMKYRCKGCRKIYIFDPREVPTQCPHCDTLHSFMRLQTKVA